MKSANWIAVLPKNYRRIVLYAIETAIAPTVLIDGHRLDDFSESGPLTQRGISAVRDFEIRDGSIRVLGFHDHPREMWIDERYQDLALHCQDQGWLEIQSEFGGGSASG